MSTAFFIAGLVVTLVGVVLVLLGKFEKPEVKPEPGKESIDVAKILEQLNKTLELVEQRYRIGIVLMAVGLALVGVGVFLEAKDAKDAAEAAAGATGLLFIDRRRLGGRS
ncbi:MAG: hypothetical protein JW940_21695 [Polyangiaceae bacterium]|nr:hypothetical protein [Polyangiaceae bacterium]